MGPFLNKCIAICKKCVKQIKPSVLPLRRYIAGSPRDHREAKRARTYFSISVVIVFWPEGYVEDFNLTRDNTEGGAEKQEMYMNLKTGAESGLDYSTKW